MTKETDTPETDDLVLAMNGKDDATHLIALDKLSRKLESALVKARRSRTAVVEKYQAAVKEAHEAGQQRDEARRLAEIHRNRSCEDQDKADKIILPWENKWPELTPTEQNTVSPLSA